MVTALPKAGGVAVAHTVQDLRKSVAAWRAAGARIALVPTMGALHAGHLGLVAQAKRCADRIIMSLFVNPMQFAPNEDFSAYPRRIVEDAEKFAGAGGDLLFAPAAEEMYPNGFATTVAVAGPATAGLEDKFRPTHFAGVTTVVTKLLLQSRPDVALFGEKDYQQLKAISRLVRDLDFDINIIGVPIVREPDGLAMSSRNLYLSREERARAPRLYEILCECAEALNRGFELEVAVTAAVDALLAAGFAPDYVEVRHAETLAPVISLQDGPLRLLAAARLGTTRLIDNVAV